MIREIIFCGFVFVTVAAPIEEKQAQILIFENESDGKGNYKFRFVTSNDITREESGTVVNEGKPDQHIYVVGFFSFKDADGITQKIHYAADKNGFIILPPGPMEVPQQLSSTVVASLLG